MAKDKNSFFLCVILLLLCLCSWSNIHAQQQAVIDEYFTETDGLSNKAVRCIIKDGYGVLWIGTMYGLNRFDGRSFRHFTTEEGLHSNALALLRRLNDRYLLLLYGKSDIRYFALSQLQVFDVLTKKVVEWQAVANLFPFPITDIKLVQGSNRDLGLFFHLKNGKYFFFDGESKFKEIPGLSPSLHFLAQTNEEHWVAMLNEDSLVVLRRNEQGKTLQRVNLGYKSDNDLCFLGTATDGSVYFGVLFRGILDKHYAVQVLPSGKCRTVFDFSFHKDRGLIDVFEIIQNPITKNYWAINKQKVTLFSEHWEVICEVPQPSPEMDSDKNMVHSIRQAYFDGNTIWQPSYAGFYKIDLYNPQFETIFRFNPIKGVRAMLRFKE
jgi:hypothetical protein